MTPLMLALELAERTCRCELNGREYTLAERAVILSTYVPPEHAVAAMLYDAHKLGLLEGEFPSEAESAIAAAEDRLKVDTSGVASLPSLHAAHIYVVRFSELG